MLFRQVKRDPAVFRKYLGGSLHLIFQWMRRLTLQLSIMLLFLTTESGHSQTIQVTVWKLIQDLIWKSTRQTHQIPDNTTVITSHNCQFFYCFSWQHPAPFKNIRPLFGKWCRISVGRCWYSYVIHYGWKDIPIFKRRSVYHHQDQNPANFKKLRPLLGMSQWISSFSKQWPEFFQGKQLQHFAAIILVIY